MNIKKIIKETGKFVSENRFLTIFIILLVFFFSTESYCRRKEKSLIEVLNPDWYKDVTKFPYYAFPPKSDHTNYNMIIKKGYEIMRDKRVIICGLGMNIEREIPNLKKRVEQLGRYFKDWRFVIFENDSDDNTRMLLKKWTYENNRVILIECEEEKNCRLKRTKATQNGVMSSERMKKMVEYRNRIIERVRKNYLDYDDIITFDLDIRGPWSLDGIAHSFGKEREWDMVTAYGLSGICLSGGIPMYYDIIAYTDDNNDVFKNIFHFFKIVYKMTFPKNKQNELISCNSAFAGLSICKMDVIRKGVNYTPQDNNYKCEHIIFCDNMRKTGFKRVKINTNMIVLVGAQGDTKNYPFY